MKGLGGHFINGPAGKQCVTVPKLLPKEPTPKTTDADVLKKIFLNGSFIIFFFIIKMSKVECVNVLSVEAATEWRSHEMPTVWDRRPEERWL